MLAIELVGAERPVGMIGLFGLDQLEQAARFGYWIIREYRGRGIGMQASRLLAAWAFRQMPVELLCIDVEPGNRASQRVAEGLGARQSDQSTRRVADETVVLYRYVLSRPDLDSTRPMIEPAPQ